MFFLGNESWFRSGGIPQEQIVHMDWGQEAILSPPSSEVSVRFICTPAQHGSGKLTFHDPVNATNN
jgi:N-acyl-phosphatidylethanolamine-hydrolysing phospholipase D